MRNLISIADNGIKKSFEGGVYLTDSQKSALAWTFMRHNGDDILVVEVEVPESNLEPGIDHSPLMQELFGCGESYLHKGDISHRRIVKYIQFKTGNYGKSLYE